MDIQIRKATLNDLEQIDNIEQSLEHRILSYDTLLSTLNKGTYYYYVAIMDNKIVGYIALELLVDHFDLLSLAVLKEYRRKNVATMLMDSFFRICRDLNILDVFLEVRCNNLSAISFYEKYGFTNISRRKNYYADTNEDAYIYKKEV